MNERPPLEPTYLAPGEELGALLMVGLVIFGTILLVRRLSRRN